MDSENSKGKAAKAKEKRKGAKKASSSGSSSEESGETSSGGERFCLYTVVYFMTSIFLYEVNLKIILSFK